MQLQGVQRWTAVTTIHDHVFTVQSGTVSIDMRQKAKLCNVHVPRQALAEKMLGMSMGAYFRMVNAQRAWRTRCQALAAAHALQMRLSATRVSRAMRNHLHRAPRTCFVCLDTVRWDSMISLVPAAKCHRICSGCASRHIDVALTEGRMHVRCPGESCKHVLSKDTISKLASPASLSQWKQNQKSANARRAAGLATEDGAFLAFCSEHTRICPGCHVIIYRHAGCDHMTCQCGFEFDWKRAVEAQIER
uniref:RING-type domain-containing protein n=1 Tax=Haptolina brevifila TaxID=156173 RepID=A0A7S2CVA5_9EUKA|mmetsp:Transcript_29378/g.59142  ORF Transcript_29378/g.59142 Transcript_29378/m.59142 type:complete len:248 (+) Transcript_29378:348-1091(+)